MMIRILQTRKTYAAPLLALGVFVCASFALMASAPRADDMYRAAPDSITIFTTKLPLELTTTTRMSGLSVVEIEHLGALEANIVHVQLGEDHAPETAVRIFNKAYPSAEFELFEDFEAEEASLEPIFE